MKKKPRKPKLTIFKRLQLRLAADDHSWLRPDAPTPLGGKSQPTKIFDERSKTTWQRNGLN